MDLISLVSASTKMTTPIIPSKELLIGNRPEDASELEISTIKIPRGTPIFNLKPSQSILTQRQARAERILSV